jgi:hypothetical protein
MAFTLFVALALVAGLGATQAMAQSPHFVGKTTATLNDDGSLTVSWKEAGLGNNQEIDYSAGATTSTIIEGCMNNGGAFPNADNKGETGGPALATGSFSSGKNGQITASLTAFPPETELVCPGGQTKVVCQVSYFDIHVTDETNGVTEAATPSTLSATLFPECVEEQG